MNKDVLEKRLAELQKQLDQIEANGNAIIGAMQECRYWLSVIEQNGAGENPAPKGEA